MPVANPIRLVRVGGREEFSRRLAEDFAGVMDFLYGLVKQLLRSEVPISDWCDEKMPRTRPVDCVTMRLVEVGDDERNAYLSVERATLVGSVIEGLATDEEIEEALRAGRVLDLSNEPLLWPSYEVFREERRRYEELRSRVANAIGCKQL